MAVPKKADLQKSLKRCIKAFDAVMTPVINGKPADIDFGNTWAAWEKYYEGEFARFDHLFAQYVAGNGEDFGIFTPVSISHHNLHRLMEVLHLEINGNKLDTTRVPERIDDLVEIGKRLSDLMKETTKA